MSLDRRPTFLWEYLSKANFDNLFLKQIITLFSKNCALSLTCVVNSFSYKIVTML
jgi:hypothetical protein